MLYRFGECELDAGRHEFRVREQLRDLEPQVFDLLLHLVENHDRLVSRDELIAVVWKGHIVSESTIDARMHAARKAVDDDGRRQARIKTVPKRGYRFTAEVEVVRGNGQIGTDNDVAVKDAPSVLTDRPSIAVLPFINLSDDPDQEFFADGMAEDIITALSKFRWLYVIARNSTFAYKNKAVDVRNVATELGVRYVLEGSVRRSSNRIRISAQLIDADTGAHIWADHYDRNVEDIFAVQDQITDAIVGALGPQIDRTERIRARRRPTERLDAWTQYQLALSAYHTARFDGLASAAKLFDRATEMDPEFAVAYTMAAAARNRLVLNYGVEESDRFLKEAGKRLSIAIDLDPQDSTCHCIKGIWHTLHLNFDLAIDSLAEAVKLNPSSAEAHYFSTHVLRRAGRPEQALAMVDRAIGLSPNDARIAAFRTDRAACLFDLERYEAAVEWARLAIHSPNPRARAYVTLAAALVHLDHVDEANNVLEDLRSRFTTFSVPSYLRSREGEKSLGQKRLLEALQQLGCSE